MRLHRALIGMFICICAILAAPVTAQDDSAAAAQVAVTDVFIDPAIFFEDDTGIINVEITNNGAQSVAIRRATIYGGDVTVLSRLHDRGGLPNRSLRSSKDDIHADRSRIPSRPYVRSKAKSR